MSMTQAEQLDKICAALVDPISGHEMNEPVLLRCGTVVDATSVRHGHCPLTGDDEDVSSLPRVRALTGLIDSVRSMSIPPGPLTEAARTRATRNELMMLIREESTMSQETARVEARERTLAHESVRAAEMAKVTSTRVSKAEAELARTRRMSRHLSEEIRHRRQLADKARAVERLMATGNDPDEHEDLDELDLDALAVYRIGKVMKELEKSDQAIALLETAQARARAVGQRAEPVFESPGSTEKRVQARLPVRGPEAGSIVMPSRAGLVQWQGAFESGLKRRKKKGVGVRKKAKRGSR
ncbi:hypothetical protein J8273_1888 [Carpediemonas membranifera]|uniref:Uncharacterized protein n=1 Tax=Carpediemonas membranifera TaxID=201153 RepID=A0A8J6AWU8_9EUKA|nr:hypothetical protein J8273_1888 [Carpediemonas membranifera]|eukprot:KAG9396841.1 hypothetical protein J8273_1888 [Carpediemonas membranifera]